MKRPLQFLIVLAVALDGALIGACFAQSDELASLHARVIELYQAEKYSEALPLAQRDLAAEEKKFGRDHLRVADCLNNLAALENRLGRYADAEQLFKRSLAIREKKLGPDHPDVAQSLNNLADLYQNRGRYADAKPLLKRSLAIMEKAHGPVHPDVATLLDNLARLYESDGQYADAEPLAKRSLAIREELLGPDDLDITESLDNLAQLYQIGGRYAVAEPLLERSLAIREKVLGPDHPGVAEALNDLGRLYQDEGRLEDAESLEKRSLAIREKLLGPDHPDVSDIINNLAGVYKDEGRLEDAESLEKRSLAIVEKVRGRDHPETAVALNNLAALYDAQRRYADAEPLYRRSLAIREKAFGPDHPVVGQSLNNLAYLYEDEGRSADAEPLYKRSLAIREKALGPDHPDVGQSLDNLAYLYEHEGRYADAEPLYKRSLAIMERALDPDHPNVAALLGNLADLYRKQGRYADALPLVQRVIPSGQSPSAIALPVLYGAQTKDLIFAPRAMDAALDVVQRTTQTSAAAAVGKLAVRLAAGNDRLAQLIRRDQDLAGEADALDKAIITAVSKEPSQRDGAAEQRVRDRLAAVATERAALKKTFATEFPDYAALSNPAPLTTANAQSLLSRDEALVVFSAGRDDSSYVFAMTRDRFDWKEIPLGAAALSRKVAAFRVGLDVDQFESGKTHPFDLDLANELYMSLFGPVEALVKDKKQLLVVPSGALTALPFHLLVTEKPAKAIPEDLADYRNAAWLIKGQAVAVLPSLASLKALRTFGLKNQATKPLIGFGDPIFNPAAVPASESRAETRPVARNLDTRSYTDYWHGAAVDRSEIAQRLAQLPDTALELKTIAQEVGAPSSDIYLGKDANETTVKHAALSDYRIVYFATHALVAGDIKGLAEPMIVLSIPRQPNDLDDGLLTASEVAQLKLNADWVVLSACNTIAGDKPGAEALSGLARSFFYAGARALLVSHWAVASEAATRLTTSTFEVLKSSPRLGRAEALREAMLGYLNDQSSPKNAYPAYWGPFAIIGEGGTSDAAVTAPTVYSFDNLWRDRAMDRLEGK